MTSFYTLTIRTLFWDIFLLFTINMVKKRSEQMYMTLNRKTCPKQKPTQNNHISHPNLLHIIFGHFAARLKNITIKSLGILTRKLAKVTKQHMMTSFCAQTIRTLFWHFFLLFTINIVKKHSEQMYMTLNTKTWQTQKPTPNNYISHPNLLHIIFSHFVVVSHEYG